MFRAHMQKLLDEYLLEAFEELQEMQSTGILRKDGVVRGLIGIYKDFYHTADASISVLEKEIYYEMAMRFYAIKKF